MSLINEDIKNKIRKLIIVIFNDNVLLEHFALKGENVLFIDHNINDRAPNDSFNQCVF